MYHCLDLPCLQVPHSFQYWNNFIHLKPILANFFKLILLPCNFLSVHQNNIKCNDMIKKWRNTVINLFAKVGLSSSVFQPVTVFIQWESPARRDGADAVLIQGSLSGLVVAADAYYLWRVALYRPYLPHPHSRQNTWWRQSRSVLVPVHFSTLLNVLIKLSICEESVVL